MFREDARTALRMQRQYLHRPAKPAEYDDLFRAMSPVPTVYWSAPGGPPRLPPHAAFDDGAYNYERRARRAIVKGRFQNGGIGYVDLRDLPLYAAAYRRDPAEATARELQLLRLLEREGPLTIGAIKEATGLLVKAITPLLHKLQERFLVFEDQAHNDGDRGWYAFDGEFPDMDWDRYSRREAMEEILLRFVSLHGAADAGMMRAWSRFPAREIREITAGLLAAGRLAEAEPGLYARPEDMALLTREPDWRPAGLLALQRNDFLARSYEPVLKERYRREGSDVVCWLLENGEFIGAVFGHFKFGPALVDEVVADTAAPPQELAAALAAVDCLRGSVVARINGRGVPPLTVG